MKSGCFITMSLLAAIAAAQETRVRPLPDLDRDPKNGPAAGTMIPAFEVADHAGRMQTFETLRGPRGLVLLFVRSADW